MTEEDPPIIDLWLLHASAHLLTPTYVVAHPYMNTYTSTLTIFFFNLRLTLWNAYSMPRTLLGI